jgi:hypothetical protein
MAGALLRLGGRFVLSAKAAEERSFPEGGGLAFKESLRVRFPSIGLERKLLIWEKSD